MLCAQASAGFAEDLTCVNTTFRLIGKDDKVCVSAFDDPKVPGVACHISQAKTGGLGGSLGLAEDPSRFSIACRQVGPISVDIDSFARERESLRRPYIDLLQAHQCFQVRGQEAQHADLCGDKRQVDRGIAAKLNLHGSHHAVGRRSLNPGSSGLFRLFALPGLIRAISMPLIMVMMITACAEGALQRLPEGQDQARKNGGCSHKRPRAKPAGNADAGGEPDGGCGRQASDPLPGRDCAESHRLREIRRP